MTPQPAPGPVIRAIMAKDLRLFARDRFYSFISVLTLVFFGALFWVLPSDVQATIKVGVYLPDGEDLFSDAQSNTTDEGLEIVVFESAQALEAAVRAGQDVVAGLSFPNNFLEDIAQGDPTSAQVLLSGGAPTALRAAMSGAARELVLAMAGQEPPFALADDDIVILGDDRSTPLALREQFRPLVIFVVLLMEMFALGALVATEISQRTASAILVTPARVWQVIGAKATFGTTLAFGQAMLVALVTGTLGQRAAIITVTLLLGAVLVTGFGLLAGSTGQDFVAIVFWSMLFFVPLAIPAFAVMFPGTPAGWIQALPSFGLIEALLRTSAYGQGWAQVWPYLASLAAWCATILALGTVVLSRRVARS